MVEFWINEWLDRYEVNSKNRAAKPGDKLREKPLEYVRLSVFGRAQGEGWRELSRRLEGNQALIYEHFGLFVKLLEVAGDHRAQDRGRLGSLDRIAKITGYTHQYKVRLAKMLEVLAHPDLGWLAPGEPGNPRQMPAESETTGPLIRRETETETDKEERATNSQPTINKQKRQPRSKGKSKKISIENSLASLKPRDQQATFAAMADSRITRHNPNREPSQRKADIIACNKVAIQAASLAQNPRILAHTLARHYQDLDRILDQPNNKNPLAVWITSRNT